MDYFTIDQERTLLFVALTFVTVLLIVAWAFLIEMRGCGLWGWLTPPAQRLKEDYRRVFLAPSEPADGRPVPLSGETYAAMAHIHRIVAPDISLPAFVDNILRDHLNRFGSHIRALMEENTNKNE